LTDNNRPTGLLIALFGAIFAASAGTHALTPIFPELKTAFSVGDGSVRQLTVVFTLGYSFSGLVLGMLCDRLGRRLILLPCLFGYGLASGLLLLPLEWLGFGRVLALRAVAGLATGGITATVIAVTSDFVAYERRGRAMSFVLSGTYVAVILGVPLSGALARYRLFGVFGVLALVTLLAALALIRRLPQDGVRGRSVADGRPVARLLDLPLRALRCKAALPALVTTMLGTLSTFAVITSLADHAVDRFGAGLGQRALLFLCLGLGALPGAFLAGLLSDRLGKRRMILIALSGSLLFAPLLLWPDRWPLFILVAILISLVQVLRQGPFAALLTGLAPVHLRGSLVGLNSAFSGVGLGIGTWLGGWTYSSHGLSGGVVVAVLGLLFSLLLFGFCVHERPDAMKNGSASDSREV
jgi:predicted MFS family arabinose efflux permease